MTKEILSVKKLTKTYSQNNNSICILKTINFNIFEGDVISISGPSGSGKSTFLNILGLLDSEFIGEIFFLGKNITTFSNNDKNIFRNKFIGFVHQFFHLIPELNVLENVCLPNLIKDNKKLNSIKIAKEILNNFSLNDKIYSKPLNLSGGEQQRVAIARALINKPKIILADEMTGNLDEKNADNVFNFFLEQIKLNKQSLVYVTHNQNYAKKANFKFKIINQQLIPN